MAKDKMKAWYDDIDAATLQRIKTYSAFNDAMSKNLMMQTMYECREKEIQDFKETNHELAETCIARKKRIAELEKENTELKTKKIPQLERKIASIRGAHSVDCKKLNTRLEQVERLKKENALVKSLLYGTQRTCDNCGFVNCENFQRQRKSEPCSLYIPYQVRIKNLAHENDVLRENYNNSEMNLAFVSEQLAKAKNLIIRLSTCFDSYANNIFENELLKEAEQFLNSEVEHE